MKTQHLSPACLFATWPTVPTVSSLDFLGKPDALVFYVPADPMAYVVHREPYAPLGELFNEDGSVNLTGLVKERVAWPEEYIEAAAKAGHERFLYNASWRARNARLLWRDGAPTGGAYMGWAQEESARAGELRQMMEREGASHVVELWGGTP